MPRSFQPSHSCHEKCCAAAEGRQRAADGGSGGAGGRRAGVENLFSRSEVCDEGVEERGLGVEDQVRPVDAVGDAQLLLFEDHLAVHS